jgi:hypothetical protein
MYQTHDDILKSVTTLEQVIIISLPTATNNSSYLNANRIPFIAVIDFVCMVPPDTSSDNYCWPKLLALLRPGKPELPNMRVIVIMAVIKKYIPYSLLLSFSVV